MLEHTTRMKERVFEEGLVGTPEDRGFLALPCLVPSGREPNKCRSVHVDDIGPLFFFRFRLVIIWEHLLMRKLVDVFLHAEKAVEYVPREEYWLDRKSLTQRQSSRFCMAM